MDSVSGHPHSAGTHSLRAAAPARQSRHGGAQGNVDWAGTISRCTTDTPQENKHHVLTAMDRHLDKATTLSHEKLRSDDVRIEPYPLTDDPAIFTLYDSLTGSGLQDDSLVAFMYAFLSCHDGDFYGQPATQNAQENRMCLVYGVVQKDALNGFPLLTTLLEKANDIDHTGRAAQLIKQLIYDMRPVQIAAPFKIAREKLADFLATLAEKAFINQATFTKTFTEPVRHAIESDYCSTRAFERLYSLLDKFNSSPHVDEKKELCQEIQVLVQATGTSAYSVPTSSNALNNLKFNTGPLLDVFLGDPTGCLHFCMGGKPTTDISYPSFIDTFEQFQSRTNGHSPFDAMSEEVKSDLFKTAKEGGIKTVYETSLTQTLFMNVAEKARMNRQIEQQTILLQQKTQALRNAGGQDY